MHGHTPPQKYTYQGVKHIEFKLEKADKNRAYIGASPDGIMYCKCHGKSILEVKCPYNIRYSFIKGDIDTCSFLSRDNREVAINKGHNYYTQVISQIQLSKSNQGYFIVWTTKDLFIEIVAKNEAFWEKISINLEIFFKRFVATRLLTINPLKFCGTCQKVLLEKLEISSKETNMRSICCNQCRIWYHCECEKVLEIIDKDITAYQIF